MDSINVRVAKRLLEIKAVFLRPQEPFTWASGIKSPIYCDNRLILTAPEARNEVEQAIADTVKREYPEAEVLMGTATAGIAHAAIAAHLLGLPMGYVRSGNKDHGRQNRIEGRLDKGEKVVVVEDLISTGGSVLETVEALREAGALRAPCCPLADRCWAFPPPPAPPPPRARAWRTPSGWSAPTATSSPCATPRRARLWWQRSTLWCR